MFSSKKNRKYIKGYARLAPPPPHIPLEKRMAAIQELRSKDRKQRYSLSQNLGISIAAFLISRISKIFYYSYRCKNFNIHPETESLIDNPRGQFIIASWHSRLFYVPISVSRNVLRKGHDSLVMVSPSRDGEITTRISENLGFYVTRGSSSRKGVRALQEIRRYLNLHFHPVNHRRWATWAALRT